MGLEPASWRRRMSRDGREKPSEEREREREREILILPLLWFETGSPNMSHTVQSSITKNSDKKHTRSTSIHDGTGRYVL